MNFRQVVTIVQFPDHSRLNPLIDLYRQALTEAGVMVQRHTMYPTVSGTEPELSARWLWSHRHKVQVLHFHWYQRLYQSDRLIWTLIKFAAFAVKIFLAHNRLGYRLTWTAHNLFPHERRFPLLDKWARWLVTHRASIVFVESETAQDVVQRTFPWIRNIEQIPQGHFAGVYPKGKPMEDARTELSIPLDAFVFLTFGLIRAYKGVETLIEAFLRELAGPHCYLVIAGAPHTAEIRSAIERLAADSPYVRLKLGFIPNEEVETLFNACNVVVLPFSNIFTSSTTILACSLGRPVVIPQLGALPSSEKSGFFVYDPADPTGLLKAMCASMQADWREEGKKARDNMLHRDWKKIGRRMRDVFQKVVYQ